MKVASLNRAFKKSGTPAKIKLGLALQGGGSYGAFTAGALRALMEHKSFRDGSIEIIGVSGTSSGAGNGAILCDSLLEGGPDAVIKNMRSYWRDIQSYGQGLELLPHLQFWARYPNLPPLLLEYGQIFAKLSSIRPQDTLKQLISKRIHNWERLGSKPPYLFTNTVRAACENGKKEHVVFDKHSPETIICSANLREFGPYFIDGHYYYDGAEANNPCLEPLESLDEITDLLAITLHKSPDKSQKPAHQDEIIQQSQEQEGFMITHEINAHLDQIHHDPDKTYHLHEIALEPHPQWNDTSRMNFMSSWIKQLYDMGYETAQTWLKENADKLGHESSYSVNIRPQTQCNALNRAL